MSGTFRHQYGRYRIGPGGDPNPPPPFPTGLAVVSVTDQSVTLSWNAVVDVAAYQLWRAPTLNGTYAVVATTVNLTASDSGLTFATGYYYKISCFRIVGTSSALSPAVVGTTGPDVTAPTIPLGLVTSNFTTSSIDLDWLASTDPLGSGVHHYEVYRAPQKIGPYARIGGNVVGLDYTAVGLSPSSTYWFRLYAVDVAGNVSGPSAPETGTTLSDSIIPRTGTIRGITTDAVFVGPWGWTEDIVSGWDWSHPPSFANAGAAIGGVYTGSNSAFPSGWLGNKVLNLDLSWREVEATQGVYNFSDLSAALNNPNYDGVLLNFRAWVVDLVDAKGVPLTAYRSEITAPTWLTSPTYTEALHTGSPPFRVKALLTYDSNVKSKYLACVTALKNSGLLSHPKFWGGILHTPSTSSRGEEGQSMQGNPTLAMPALREIINAWSVAMGSNVSRLMWTDDSGANETLFDYAVTSGGMGARGGAIENWLRNRYTPGFKKFTQQVWTNGYLSVDESNIIVSGNRGRLDENEFYNRPSSDHDELVPWIQQKFRMANLRTNQMRRKFNWLDAGFVMNPQQSIWHNVLLGHEADTTPEAFCCLMLTYVKSANNEVGNYVEREIKNLEFFLTQRDVAGATTTAVLKTPHGYDPTNGSGLDPTKLYLWCARTGANIEFVLDSRFINDARNVAIKVTWYHSVNESWSLVYNKVGGGTVTKTVAGSAPTNIAKTKTFFLDDFTGASAIDFRLTSGGTTPFMFVRVIKL